MAEVNRMEGGEGRMGMSDQAGTQSLHWRAGGQAGRKFGRKGRKGRVCLTQNWLLIIACFFIVFFYFLFFFCHGNENVGSVWNELVKLIDDRSK